jgi:hypothetical protein
LSINISSKDKHSLPLLAKHLIPLEVFNVPLGNTLEDINALNQDPNFVFIFLFELDEVLALIPKSKIILFEFGIKLHLVTSLFINGIISDFFELWFIGHS